MTAPAKCTFCGQPLINREAVEHLRRSHAKFEKELRRELAAEARADLKNRLKVERESARAKADEEVARLDSQLKKKDEQLTALRTEGERRAGSLGGEGPGEVRAQAGGAAASARADG